jgi:hypothetical protein
MSEIHASSGHHSQNAATGVATLPEARLGVWVRWPGERITRKEVTPDLGEIRLKHGGPDQYPPTQTNFRGTLGLIGKRFPDPDRPLRGERETPGSAAASEHLHPSRSSREFH